MNTDSSDIGMSVTDKAALVLLSQLLQAHRENWPDNFEPIVEVVATTFPDADMGKIAAVIDKIFESAAAERQGDD